MVVKACVLCFMALYIPGVDPTLVENVNCFNTVTFCVKVQMEC